MTATLGTDVMVARRFEVRMVFGYLDDRDATDMPYPFSIGTAVSHMQGIEDLLFLASVEDRTGPPNDTSLGSPANFVSQVRVKRIAYASPLEVVVSFIAGTRAAALVANRLIAVWDNFQSARRNTKNSDLWVAAGNVLQATVEAPVPVSPGTPGYHRFTNAADVLRLLSALEVNEET
jgi:hypothetical protein